MSRLKDFEIHNLRKKWGLTSLIETGTYKGDGVKDALDAGFTPIFTCDVESSFTEKPEIKEFMLQDDVHFYHGRSTKCLPIMLDAAGNKPALVFLDAHCDPSLFDGKLVGKKPDDGDPLPMLTELKILTKQRDVSKDVIIIDDMHLYVKEMAVSRHDGWSTPMPPCPFTTATEMIDFVLKYLPNHKIRIWNVHDVILLCTPKKREIYVDIDETICHYKGVDRLGYKEAKPIQENINKINILFDEGNYITYWTSRGNVSGSSYYDLTENQLKEWGCKYHELIVGEKPVYDLLICDKTKRIEEI